MPVLDVSGLTKRYGDTLAVRDVSFGVDAGRILALVGPNGAGKTTTMRAVLGLVRPTAGRVRVGGTDLGLDPVGVKRRSAWVPHDPQLYDALTVREHLAVAARLWEVPPEVAAARGEALLERFELLPKADEPAQALSRGMKQKVALASAGVHAPELLLLDEPMTGLDPRGIRELKTWVREEAARGAGVVISSHLLSMVEDLATDLLVLVRGELRFLDTLEAARAAWPGHTLEDLFLKLTQDAPA